MKNLTVIFPMAAIIAISSFAQQSEAQVFRSSRSSCYCPCQSNYGYAPANYQVAPQPSYYVPNNIVVQGSPAIQSNVASTQPFPAPVPAQPIMLQSPVPVAQGITTSIPAPVSSSVVESNPTMILAAPDGTVTGTSIPTAAPTIAPVTYDAPVATSSTINASPVAPAVATETVAPVATGDTQITPEPAAEIEKSVLDKQ